MTSLTPNTKDEQDAAQSPEERAKRLREAEQRAAFDKDFEDPERLAKDGVPGDLAGGALTKEKNPPANWKTTVAGIAEETILARSGRADKAKNKSPLVAILILIFIGGGTSAGVFIALSSLPIHIASLLTDKFDSQITSFNPSYRQDDKCQNCG